MIGMLIVHGAEPKKRTLAESSSNDDAFEDDSDDIPDPLALFQ